MVLVFQCPCWAHGIRDIKAQQNVGRESPRLIGKEISPQKGNSENVKGLFTRRLWKHLILAKLSERLLLDH
jgi:hypothetical protein